MRVRHPAPTSHIAPFAPVPVGDVHTFMKFDIFGTWKPRILGHLEGLDLLVAVVHNLAVGRDFQQWCHERTLRPTPGLTGAWRTVCLLGSYGYVTRCRVPVL